MMQTQGKLHTALQTFQKTTKCYAEFNKTASSPNFDYNE
jgi:hypothetical protein